MVDAVAAADVVVDAVVVVVGAAAVVFVAVACSQAGRQSQWNLEGQEVDVAAVADADLQNRKEQL